MFIKNFVVIILIAGRGTRMLSNYPKILHQIAGKVMLQHLFDSLNRINIRYIYIVYDGNKKIVDVMREYLIKTNIIVHWILQKQPKGTGHAVQQVLSELHDNSEVLILYGDVPLVSYKTLKKLKCIKSKCDISLLTAQMDNPCGYGRIVRNHIGDVIRVIEEIDIIHNSHRKIKEINSGIFITTVKNLKNWLNQVTSHNLKHELYLTDIIEIAYKNDCTISTITPIDVFEVMGINNKLDLVRVEREYQKKQAQVLLELGVIISDPNRFDLRGTLLCGKDVYIDVNVIIEGDVSLGNRVKVGANCILKNVEIEDDVIIYPFSIIEHAKIGFKSRVGPFARLRSRTELKEETRVGNFVELKNMQFGKCSKVGHHSYLGDADIGSKVNIGAGTIICNYDGVNKHHTCISDNVFIGADSQLIAPITIGRYATVGAGTTVTQDIEEGETIISRVRQFSIKSKKFIKKKFD